MVQSFIKTLSKIFHFIYVFLFVIFMFTVAFLAVTKALLKVDLEISDYLIEYVIIPFIMLLKYIYDIILGLIFFRPQPWHIGVMLILVGAVLFVPRKWKKLFYSGLWLFPILVVAWNIKILPQQEQQIQTVPLALIALLLTTFIQTIKKKQAVSLKNSHFKEKSCIIPQKGTKHEKVNGYNRASRHK